MKKYAPIALFILCLFVVGTVGVAVTRLNWLQITGTARGGSGTSLGPAGYNLMADSAFELTASETLGVGTLLRAQPGSRIHTSSNVTLTVDGKIEAGDYQIFGATASVRITSGYANAAWFGATGFHSTGSVTLPWNGTFEGGTTDQSSAIQRAIVAVASSSGVVEIPEGWYYCKTTVNVYDGVTLRGRSNKKTWNDSAPDRSRNDTCLLFYPAASDTYFLVLRNEALASSSVLNDIHVEDLTLYGNYDRTADTGATAPAILALRCNHTLKNLYVSHFKVGVYTAAQVYGELKDVYFKHCDVGLNDHSATYGGVTYSTEGTTLTINTGSFIYCNLAAYLGDTLKVNFKDTVIEACGTSSYTLSESEDVAILMDQGNTEAQFVDCWFENNVGWDVKAENGNVLIMRGCRIATTKRTPYVYGSIYVDNIDRFADIDITDYGTGIRPQALLVSENCPFVRFTQTNGNNIGDATAIGTPASRANTTYYATGSLILATSTYDATVYTYICYKNGTSAAALPASYSVTTNSYGGLGNAWFSPSTITDGTATFHRVGAHVVARAYEQVPFVQRSGSDYTLYTAKRFSQTAQGEFGRGIKVPHMKFEKYEANYPDGTDAFMTFTATGTANGTSWLTASYTGALKDNVATVTGWIKIYANGTAYRIPAVETW